MYPQIHSAIAICRHPKHQATGGYFVAPNQRKEQRTRHRIRRMATDKAVLSAAIAIYQMQYTF